jgi:two-component system CheB/CheR fusion protein
MSEFPIVGIGSSAGGLEALQKLLRAMPSDSGMAVVVVAHLDPTQKSHLAELLGRCTAMPVVEVVEAVAVARDHVYIIAPDQTMTLRKGVLRTAKASAPRGRRHPVDAFFRSLAEDAGPRAIAIVLSGTGTNGSQGMQFIKAEGGVVIAQEPDSAGFQGMPRSAIATGVVDMVLPPEKMPEALMRLARHPYVRRPEQIDAKNAPAEQLNTLLSLVRAQTRQDFTSYKKATLLRRIHRRMGLAQVVSMSAYIDRLCNDREEVKALASDFMINVTGFFREPEAWAALGENVIRPLVARKSAGDTIRIWVAGCSTGEEAYSMAMLVTEYAVAAGKPLDIKLFATDVSEATLQVARAGRYPGSAESELDALRLQRFFDTDDGNLCINRMMREMITFAPQNLLQDPPFSRLDLVSCRNVLIYLEPPFQKRVLALLHFSLREDGYLFLGPAETVSPIEDLFQTVSKRWRIYRRTGPTRHDMVDFPLVAVGASSGAGGPPPPAVFAERIRAAEVINQALLDRYAPASVLIDQHYRVHYLRGALEEYLRPPSGEPSFNLLAMCRGGLQMPLRALVRSAIKQNKDAATVAQVRRGGALYPLRLLVSPIRNPRHDETMLLVSFFERDGEPDAVPADAVEVSPQGHLQSELDLARDDLRQTIEHMETTNEELKASNEEIRSINEELQTANEELETSKEELQSLNEELNMVNHQLEAKVGELEERTADLNNLLNSTDVATLFLDRNLCIRWFTPSMKALLQLRTSDIGRPVSHFAPNFRGGDLLSDARSVLVKLTPSDTEVVNEEGRWYIRHMVPYRTADERIDGVVVTFTDITHRKHSEQNLEDAKEFAETIVNTVRYPLLVLTPELRVRSANTSFYHAFGDQPGEVEGRALTDLHRGQWDIAPLRERLHRVLRDKEEFSDLEVKVDLGQDGARTMLLDGRCLDDELILLALEDVTRRRRGEDERELLTRELSHRVKNILAVIQSLAAQTAGRFTSVQDFQAVFLGRLQALARAHSLLLNAQWRGTDVSALVGQELAAYRVDDEDSVRIEGDPVPITPRQALGLSFVLHELGTNAAKYGALSRPDGRLCVSWHLERDHAQDRLRLRWRERGGPPVERPTAKGFGLQLIERACNYELGGVVELDYAPEGLSCEVVFPLM